MTADLRADTAREEAAKAIWPVIPPGDALRLAREVSEDRRRAFGIGWDAALAYLAQQRPDVEAVAGVLTEHRQTSLVGEDAMVRMGCACGWIAPRAVVGAFRTHLAEQIAALPPAAPEVVETVYAAGAFARFNVFGPRPEGQPAGLVPSRVLYRPTAADKARP